MSCSFYVFGAILILLGSEVQCNPTSQDVMPVQDFPWSDDNMNKIIHKIDSLEASNEILKARLDLQQVLFQKQVAKTEMLTNKTNNAMDSQDSVEQQNSLFEKLLQKLDNVERETKNQQNVNDELVKALNRIDTKLETVIEMKESPAEGQPRMGISSCENKTERDNELLNTLENIDSKLNKMVAETLNPKFPSDCAEALRKTNRNGIHTIIVPIYGATPFEVYCEGDTFARNWTVIQRRQDGSVDFYRNWTDYQRGFGDLEREFFIGLDKLHALTSETAQELLIELEDFNNEIAYAKYDEFAIGGETDDYALNVLGRFSGNAGDSLSAHKNKKFTTKDRDNDSDSGNCAKQRKGAWWYNNCADSNLNGPYYLGSECRKDYNAIYWFHWHKNFCSIKRTKMMIRPKM